MPILNPVRNYTADDVYHYTTDRRPILDLESNQLILSNAIDAIVQNTTPTVVNGNLSTVSATVPQGLISKHVRLKVYIFAIYNTTDYTTPSYVAEEVYLLANADSGGVLHLVGTSTQSLLKATGPASGTYGSSFSTSGGSLVVNFSWVTSINGYAQIVINRLIN